MGKSWTIGRKNSDILLNGENISRLHAVLEYVDGKFYIEDLDSTNGTTIKRKGELIKVSKSVEIFPKDTLLFSDFSISFEELRAKVDVQSVSCETIRCKECLKPISNQAPCEHCGSREHLRGDV